MNYQKYLYKRDTYNYPKKSYWEEAINNANKQ